MIKTIFKFFIIASIILVGLVVVLTGAALMAVNTETVRGMVMDRVNAAIPGSLEWQSHRIEPFRGRIAMDGLSIKDPEGEPILSADHIRIGIDLAALFRRELKVDLARIEQPRLLLAVDSEGRLNLASAFAESDADAPDEPDPDEAGPGFNVRVNVLELTGGYFEFQIPSDPPSDTADVVILEEIDIFLTAADLSGQTGHLSIRMAGGRLDMADMQAVLEKFHVDAELEQSLLSPLTIDLVLADGTALSVSGTVEDVFDQPELSLEINVNADLADIGRMLDPGIDLSGPVHLRVITAGSVNDPEVILSSEYGGGTIAGLDVDALNLEARLFEYVIRIRQLSAAAPAGDIDVSGSVDLTAAFPEGFIAGFTDLNAIICDLAATAEIPDLALAAAEFDITGPGGGIVLSAEIKGPAPTPVIQADLNGKTLSWEDIRIGNLWIDAGMDLSRGVVEIEQVRLANQESSIELSGTADLLSPGTYTFLDNPAFHLELTRGVLVARDFSDDVDGKLAFNGNINGTLQQPKATLFIKGEELEAMGRSIGDLSANMSLADGRITLDPLKLINNASAIMIRGTADVLNPETGELLSDPGMDIVLKADGVRIEDFAPEFTGRVSIDGRIRGTATRPEGELSVRAADLDLGVQHIARIDLEARLEETRVHIEPLIVGLALDQSITLTGWVDTAKNYDLKLISDPIEPSAIDAIADIFPESGRILLEASGTGNLDNPGADAEIRLSDFQVNAHVLPPLLLSLSITDQAIHATGASPPKAADTDETRENIFTKADLDLEKLNFDVQINLDGISLAPYMEMADQPDLSGNLTARLLAEGNLEALEHVRAELHIADLALFREKMEIAQTTDFQAVYDNGMISISGNRVALLKEGFFDVSGTGRIDGGLDFHLDGSVPVSLAETFTDAVIEATGRFDISAGISGTVSDPAVAAEIRFHNIGLTLPETAQRLHEVRGGIDITSDRIVIHDVQGLFDTGEFSLSGAAELADFQPVKADIDLTARAIPIKVPDTMDLLITAALNFKGDTESSMLSGEIILLDGLYYRDIEFSLLGVAADAGRARRKIPPPPETEEDGIPLLEQMAMDIDVRHRNPFIVDNNMALLRIRPDLRVHGTANRPLLMGRAEVTEGTITFQDNEFTVERGLIDFINPYEIEPTIDIAAQSEVRHWTITLTASGTPDELLLGLESTPPEEHGDIISLLLAGKTTRELAGGDGGGTGSPRQLLTNLLAEQLGKQLQAGTGLDILELEYETDPEVEDENGLRVTVGKELSRRLTLLYGMEQKSGLVVQQTTAIYKLLENLSVNAFQDTEGAYGGEMRFRLEFR
jgi:translocation and assembly module TamB